MPRIRRLQKLKKLRCQLPAMKLTELSQLPAMKLTTTELSLLPATNTQLNVRRHKDVEYVRDAHVRLIQGHPRLKAKEISIFQNHQLLSTKTVNSCAIQYTYPELGSY